MDLTKQAANIFNEYALQYQEKYMDPDLYRGSLDKFCDLVKTENARLLEIGCGPGNITKYLLEKRPDFNILAIDLAPRMIELAGRNNPTAEFQVMDCRNLGKLPERFDAVVCGFCLPYLSKEASLKLIGDVSKLLKPEGIFYLSTMEADSKKSGFVDPSSGKDREALYTWYHEAEYLETHLKMNDFKILELSRIENPVYEDSSIKDLLILAQKF